MTSDAIERPASALCRTIQSSSTAGGATFPTGDDFLQEPVDGEDRGTSGLPGLRCRRGGELPTAPSPKARGGYFARSSAAGFCAGSPRRCRQMPSGLPCRS